VACISTLDKDSKRPIVCVGVSKAEEQLFLLSASNREPACFIKSGGDLENCDNLDWGYDWTPIHTTRRTTRSRLVAAAVIANMTGTMNRGAGSPIIRTEPIEMVITSRVGM